jgi:hypothetical protein
MAPSQKANTGTEPPLQITPPVRWHSRSSRRLGHQSTDITRNYVHLAAEHLRAKAGIMGEVIAKAMEDNPPDQQPIVAEQRPDGTLVQYFPDLEV